MKDKYLGLAVIGVCIVGLGTFVGTQTTPALGGMFTAMMWGAYFFTQRVAMMEVEINRLEREISKLDDLYRQINRLHLRLCELQQPNVRI